MIIKINAIELASELAHRELVKNYLAPYLQEGNMMVSEDDLFEGENYKKEFQEPFIVLYDFYFELITNLMEDEN